MAALTNELEFERWYEVTRKNIDFVRDETSREILIKELEASKKLLRLAFLAGINKQ